MAQKRTQVSVVVTAPEEEESYFDDFYDEPGTMPGTLSIEAVPSRLLWF